MSIRMCYIFLYQTFRHVVLTERHTFLTGGNVDTSGQVRVWRKLRLFGIDMTGSVVAGPIQGL